MVWDFFLGKICPNILFLVSDFQNQGILIFVNTFRFSVFYVIFVEEVLLINALKKLATVQRLNYYPPKLVQPQNENIHTK